MERRSKKTPFGYGILSPIISVAMLVLGGIWLGLSACPFLRSLKDPRWANLADLPLVFTTITGAGAIFVGLHTAYNHHQRTIDKAREEGYQQGIEKHPSRQPHPDYDEEDEVD